jgi:hypothetical protein
MATIAGVSVLKTMSFSATQEVFHFSGSRCGSDPGITVKKISSTPICSGIETWGSTHGTYQRGRHKMMATMDSNYYAPNKGVDTSLTAVTMFDNNTNYKEFSGLYLPNRYGWR